MSKLRNTTGGVIVEPDYVSDQVELLGEEVVVPEAATEITITLKTWRSKIPVTPVKWGHF